MAIGDQPGEPPKDVHITHFLNPNHFWLMENALTSEREVQIQELRRQEAAFQEYSKISRDGRMIYDAQEKDVSDEQTKKSCKAACLFR